MAQLQSEAVCSGKLANWHRKSEWEHSFSEHFEDVESGRKAHILQWHSVRFTFSIKEPKNLSHNVQCQEGKKTHFVLCCFFPRCELTVERTTPSVWTPAICSCSIPFYLCARSVIVFSRFHSLSLSLVAIASLSLSLSHSLSISPLYLNVWFLMCV